MTQLYSNSYMQDNEKIETIKKWLGSGSINIFGKPFAGKDNQGTRLVKLLGGNLIGGGDVLRGSNIPDRIKQAMSAGELIPSDDYISIVLPFLSQPTFDNQPLILSAVGRWHGEEEGAVRALLKSGHPLKSVIYINIPDDTAHERWLVRETFNDRYNRPDDNENILKVRLGEFNSKTVQVIDYYEKLGLLIEVDGCDTRDNVTRNIIDKIFDRI